MNAPPKNQLYYGDNLAVLREHIRDESVDLIYLDLPFNSRQEPGSPSRPVLAWRGAGLQRALRRAQSLP